jgi:DUF1009 family protein
MVPPNLAIVAGAGDLPRQLADHCERIGRGYKIIQFDGVTLNWADSLPVIQARFEKPDKLFKALKAAACQEVVFAGGMQRPKLNPLKFDLKLMKLAPTLLPALKNGDDGTLRLIAQIFEAEGLTVVAAHDILENLMNTEGSIGQFSPSNQDLDDIQRGFDILDAMAAADVGQSCVVGQGLCLGIETIQGTDAMLGFVGKSKSKFLPDPDGPKGVFIKAPKHGQDRRMDMPTIGPDTIRAVERAGLAGISVVKNDIQIIDLEQCISISNELGVFVTVVKR